MKKSTVADKPYHVVSKKDTQELVHLLAKNGQALLPMVELIELLGRGQIEAILGRGGNFYAFEALFFQPLLLVVFPGKSLDDPDGRNHFLDD